MSPENWKKLQEKFDAAMDDLENMTEEEREKYFPKDTRPKGWLDIEEYLPMMYVEDIGKGYSEYKVKYADETEGMTKVSDHNTWYYYAKEEGITHWWNE